MQCDLPLCIDFIAFSKASRFEESALAERLYTNWLSNSAQLILNPNPRAGGEFAFRIGAANEFNRGFAVIGGA